MDITKLSKDIHYDLTAGINSYDTTYKVIKDLLNDNYSLFIDILDKNLTISSILATSVELYSNEIRFHFIYEFIRCELIIFTLEPQKLHFSFYALNGNVLLSTAIVMLRPTEIESIKLDDLLLKRRYERRKY